MQGFGKPILVILAMGSGHSNILTKKETVSKNGSIWVLIGQFSHKNWPIKDGGCQWTELDGIPACGVDFSGRLLGRKEDHFGTLHGAYPQVKLLIVLKSL